jgi:hypothetical protein
MTRSSAKGLQVPRMWPLIILAVWLLGVILCWKVVMPRFAGPGASILKVASVSLLAGSVLAPGLILGHGVLPMPAGLGVACSIYIYLTMQPDYDWYWMMVAGNLASWLILSTIFFLRDP